MMFSASFSAAFAGLAGRGKSGFSAAFSGRFAGVAVPVSGYICPMRAQAEIVGGAAWWFDDGRLIVGGRVLIGQAGKVFAFASSETAARWVENAKNIGAREAALRVTLAIPALASWAAKKREKLAVIAGRVVAAAAKQGDEAKRAALLAESDYCLSKWG